MHPGGSAKARLYSPTKLIDFRLTGKTSGCSKLGPKDACFKPAGKSIGQLNLASLLNLRFSKVEGRVTGKSKSLPKYTCLRPSSKLMG